MSLFGWGGRKSPVRKAPRRILLQLEVLEDRTVPATFNVAAGDVNTLIADMAQANSNGDSSNTINLAAGTYNLTAVNNNWYGPNGLPAITNNLTINGNGAVVARDSSLGLNTPFRFFYIAGSSTAGQAAGSLTLTNLTLEGGLAQGGDSNTGGGGLGAGGAIFNQGNLTLNGVTVTQNMALGGNGGTGTAGGGGGIGQDGQGDNGGGFGGTVSGSGGGTGVLGGAGGSFGAGGTGGSGGGGGIGGGGGDSTSGTAGAGGFGGGGGGGASAGGAGGFGGGGGGGGSGVAGGFGGGAGSSGAGGGGAALGGAIFNMYGTTTLINSTLASNLAQGGSGGVNATGGSSYGGGVFNLDGTLNITNSTLASNSTTGATNGGGAVYNLALGTTPANQAGQALVTLTNSILANSIGSNDLINDQSNSTSNSAVVNATAANIVMATNTINGATTNGTPNTANPLLGLLLNYGGPTPTMPLLAGSPALAAGASGTNVPTTDQRGATRGSTIDLGAYQATSATAAGTGTTTTVSVSGNAGNGQSVTLTAIVTTTNSTTPTGTVQFVDSTTGTALGSAPLTVVNGQAQATLTTTAVNSGDSITATYQSSNGLAASTGSTAGGSSSNSNSSNQLWLQQVYHDLLGRTIDPSGMTYWTSVLSGNSRSQVAFMITQTIEYRVNEIQTSFQKLLNRSADQPTLNYFLGLMGQGTTIEGVDSIIAGSNEYYQNRGGGTDTGFLTALYQDFLNRPLDSAGQQIWQQFLATGQTRSQLVLAVLNTAEYRTNLVQNMYQTYLGRQADTASLSAFVSYLSNGGGNDDLVAAALLGSGEYLSHATTAAAG